MSATWWGALLGAVAAGGLLLVGCRLAVIRRPSLAMRVLPYVRDVGAPGVASPTRTAVVTAPSSAFAGVFGPFLRSAAGGVERALGGAGAVVASYLSHSRSTDIPGAG